MLRFFLILSILGSTLSAKGDYEQKLYESILPKIFHKNNVQIFINNNEAKKILQTSNILTIVQKCTDADILIGNSFKKEESSCQKKPSFALDYRAYKRSKNAIGAFYWRKGRPQITFNKDAFEYHKLTIPKSLQKYVQ